MGKLKKLAKEFKAFITRGNVVDMAVAVIIGAAFGAIVTALTNGILQPLINWAVAAAGGDKGIGLITMLKPGYVIDATTGLAAVDPLTGKKIIDMATSIYIDWGNFIMKIIDFLLVALVLFIIIKIFMGLKAAGNELTSKDKKAFKKQVKARAAEKEISYKAALAEINAEAEAKAAAEKAAKEAEEAAKPTPEKLLMEIRDLLLAQNAANGIKPLGEETEDGEEGESEEKAEEEKPEVAEEQTEKKEKDE